MMFPKLFRYINKEETNKFNYFEYKYFLTY